MVGAEDGAEDDDDEEQEPPSPVLTLEGVAESLFPIMVSDEVADFQGGVLAVLGLLFDGPSAALMERKFLWGRGRRRGRRGVDGGGRFFGEVRPGGRGPAAGASARQRGAYVDRLVRGGRGGDLIHPVGSRRARGGGAE